MSALRDWFFGDPAAAYARARRNTAAMRSAGNEDDPDAALRALNGPESFLLGTLADGRALRIAAREVGRHGLVFGSSGAGKTRAVCLIADGWSLGGTRRVEIVDPKGETTALQALRVAAQYLDLRDPAERDVFAARFRVLDVTPHYVAATNLYAVPTGMSPSLLASLRAAAMRHLSDHSDLVQYGVYLVYAVAINMQCGLTVRLVRTLLLDADFRARMILPRITDARLHDSIEHIETTLPTQTRMAIVRQFDILLAPAPARISFGLSPAMVRALAPVDARATTVLGNFGPSPQRSPALAKAMAINRLIDVLNAAHVREEVVPEMVLVEEVGVIVKEPAVAEFLLEASRTLRWKGLALVCVAQDPANAIPRETCTALVLNAKWLLAFECGTEEARWLLPHIARAPDMSDAEQRQAFVREMATLPTQHAILVKKGLPAIRFRTRDLDDPTARYPRELLLETFEREIARRSLVRVKDAEELIGRWEADFFASYGGGAVTAVRGPQRSDRAPRGIADLFALLDRARGTADAEKEDGDA